MSDKPCELGDFKEIWEAHSRGFVVYAATHYTGIGTRSPEDVVQQAYLIAVMKIAAGEFRPPYHFVPWVRAIITKVASNWIRQDIREKKRKNFGTEGGAGAILENVADDRRRSRDAMEHEFRNDTEELERTLWPAMETKLMQFDEDHQTIGRFILQQVRLENGKNPSLDEIATATGIPRTSANRYRQTIFEAWARVCSKLGFAPPF